MPSPPTPCLIVDRQIAEGNIRRMSEYARSHGLRLRPHTKTHKSLRAARLQLDEGACGLSVAKVGEAEVMSQVCDDLLMAYPAVDWHRCQRLAELAQRGTVRVAVDSSLSVERLATAAQQAGSLVGILVDLDVGYGRTGLQSDNDALKLAQSVTTHRSLRLDGLLLYTGHILGPPAAQIPQMQQVQQRLETLLTEWSRLGLPCEIVSGGSTPSALQSHCIPALTEIRPGTYIFNDMNTVHGNYCTLANCAAKIHTTIVSDSVPGQVVIDAGSKTLSSDLCGPAADSGYGFVVDYPAARIVKLTEEHGQVDVSRCPAVPQVGEVVTIVPNHICVCVNLQDAVWWREPDGTLRRTAVDARGKLI